MPKIIKEIPKEERLSPFRKYREIISNRTLSFEDKLKIITSKTLVKNYKVFLVNVPEIRKQRKQNNLSTKDIRLHLAFKDYTGQTTGCGCLQCKLKHAEWKTRQEFERVTRALNKYRSSQNVLFKKENVKKYGSISHFDYYYNTGLPEYIRECKKKGIEPESLIKNRPLYYNTVNNRSINATYDPFEEQLLVRKPLIRMYLHNPDFFERRIVELTKEKKELKHKYKRFKQGKRAQSILLALPE